MKTIDVAMILSPDLKSRMRAQDLKLFIENSYDKDFTLDFANVKFATRSFMDEFYNLFIKDDSSRAYTVKLVNVPEDIKLMLDSVSRTQVKAHTIKANTPEVSFKDVNDLLRFLSTCI